MDAAPGGWTTPSSASWLARLLARRVRHPDEFDCAVRVVAGAIEGESTRWRYRRSAVDPLDLGDGVVRLNHGAGTVLHLRFAAARSDGGAAPRPYHLVWQAEELRTGASVEVAADAAESDRLRVPAE